MDGDATYLVVTMQFSYLPTFIVTTCIFITYFPIMLTHSYKRVVYTFEVAYMAQSCQTNNWNVKHGMNEMPNKFYNPIKKNQNYIQSNKNLFHTSCVSKSRWMDGRKEGMNEWMKKEEAQDP
jgi:hypothetical protein